MLPLSIRIPLGLTIAVVITGIIAFIKVTSRTGALPTTYFIIWLIVSVSLIGITTWSWLRGRKK
ncbi:MAG: hypothetical protein ACYC6L_01845 [Anaerolineae bacterium]